MVFVYSLGFLTGATKRFRFIQLLSRIYGQYAQPDAVTYIDLKHARFIRSPKLAPLQIIDLESNHAPNLQENFESVSSYITMALAAGLYFALGHMSNWSQWVADLSLTGANLYRYANHFLITSPKFKSAVAIRRYFPLGISIMNQRSKTMVASIDRVLNGDPGAAEMLAIVPKNHIDGVLRLLENQGYKRKPLL